MTQEELELAKKEAQENINKIASEKAALVADEKIKSFTEKFSGMVEKAATLEAVEEIKKSLNDEIVKLQSKIKDINSTTKTKGTDLPGDKVISEVLKSVIVNNAQALKSYRGGVLPLEVSKAIDQTSFGVGGYAALTNERLPLYRNPYSPIYLRNLFPNISTSASNLTIWKQDTTIGAADIWARGTGDADADEAKPNITPKFKKETVEVDWIAGVIDVQREVLDDVDFMQTEIPYTLVYGATGILAAENKMIMDYITNTATAFALPAGFAALDNQFEELLAAAFGQMGDSYITPTHILINNWDYLKYMAFNKAAGSGEYNQPNLNLTFVNNQMFINNLLAVPSPQVADGEAYVVAADHCRFVSRQGMQVRVSEEHADNFTKNMVTYRAEVRSGFFTYNANAIVKVTLP